MNSASHGKSSLFVSFLSIYVLDRNVSLCGDRENERKPNKLPTQWATLQKVQMFPTGLFPYQFALFPFVHKTNEF